MKFESPPENERGEALISKSKSYKRKSFQKQLKKQTNHIINTRKTI